MSWWKSNLHSHCETVGHSEPTLSSSLASLQEKVKGVKKAKRSAKADETKGGVEDARQMTFSLLDFLQSLRIWQL